MWIEAGHGHMVMRTRMSPDAVDAKLTKRFSDQVQARIEDARSVLARLTPKTRACRALARPDWTGRLAGLCRMAGQPRRAAHGAQEADHGRCWSCCALDGDGHRPLRRPI
jgi:hypothetical protein